MEDEQSSLIDTILRKAEKLAIEYKYVEDKGAWLYKFNREFIRSLESARIDQLRRIEEKDILNLLEQIEKGLEDKQSRTPPPDSCPPCGGEIYFSEPDSFAEYYGLGGFQQREAEEADIERTKAETEFLKRITEDIKRHSDKSGKDKFFGFL